MMARSTTCPRPVVSRARSAVIVANAVASAAMPSASPNGGSVGGPSGSPVIVGEPAHRLGERAEAGAVGVRPDLAEARDPREHQARG